MAAAAIASGALGPEEGAGAGLLVDGMATEIATGVGVVARTSTCWPARMVGSTAVGSVFACESSGFCLGDLPASEEELLSVDCLVLPLLWLFAVALVVPLLASVFDESLRRAVLLESALARRAGALLLAAGELLAGAFKAGGGADWEVGAAGGGGAGGGWSPCVFW